MSKENVELVREFLNTFVEVDEGLTDAERLTEFFPREATIDLGAFSAMVPGKPVLRLDGFLEFRAAWMEPYDDWGYEVEKLLDAGVNGVVATFHQRGKPRDSDSWVEMHYGIVYTVDEGLITRAKAYATPEDALEAAGLSE